MAYEWIGENCIGTHKVLCFPQSAFWSLDTYPKIQDAHLNSHVNFPLIYLKGLGICINHAFKPLCGESRHFISDTFILPLEESKEIYRTFREMAGFINYWGITAIISWLLSASYSIYSRAANSLLFSRAFVSLVDYICMICFDHFVMNIVS